METIIKPIIDKELLESLEHLVSVEKQVIVHCLMPASPFWGNLVRIWPSTVLEDRDSDHQCRLVHAENISYSPLWTEIEPMQDFWFTLVFTGLPKNCTHFNLHEIIPESGGFFVPNIKRNATDFYRIKIE